MATQSKQSRKHGRNLRSPAACRYKAEKRWAKNKARRIIRHMKKFPKYVATIHDEDVKRFVNKYIRSQKVA